MVSNVTIPVINFNRYGLHANLPNTDETLRVIGTEVRNAFQSIGFCYLTNHGIDENLLTNFKAVSRSFFEQPVSVKEPYSRPADSNFGWVAVEREKLNPERPGDLKEAFNYHPADDVGNWQPTIQQFQQLSQEVFKVFTELSHRVLDVLSIDMDLEKSFMRDSHKLIGNRGNPTALRSLYYPPIDPNSSLKPGQIRLGEHSDYGTVTLLYQDDVGGLEVQVPGGEFIPATPIPGTILVNIGDLMQRWTADSLVATKHRVMIPESEMKKRTCRQSLAFFVHPDDDFVIRCLDGSDKYEPVTSLDYLNYRFSKTY